MRKLKKTPTKELKKGETYYLTFDYTAYAGLPVKYVRTLKAPACRKGDVDVKHVSGVEFTVHKNAWLFAEDPRHQEVE